MGNTPEGRVKRVGRGVCNSLGFYWFAINQGGMSVAGTPDDVVCVNGVFVHIEYKDWMNWDKQTKFAYTTLPTEKQCLQMERCRDSGGVTLVVDKTNLKFLEPDLKAIAKAKSGDVLDLHCLWLWRHIEYCQYKEDRIKWHYVTDHIPHPIYTEITWEKP